LQQLREENKQLMEEKQRLTKENARLKEQIQVLQKSSSGKKAGIVEPPAELTVIGPKIEKFETTPLFIAEIKVNHSINTSAVEAVFGRQGYKITRVGSPLEIIFNYETIEDSPVHLQIYPDGRIVAYFIQGEFYPGTISESLRHFNGKHLDDFAVIFMNSREFSSEDIHFIDKEENWDWYATEPGIWSLWEGREDISFILDKTPKYFLIAFYGYFNGIEINMQDNYAKIAQQGENHLAARDSEGYRFALTSADATNFRPSPSYLYKINAKPMSEFWGK
jgi:hypothetical protein